MKTVRFRVCFEVEAENEFEAIEKVDELVAEAISASHTIDGLVTVNPPKGGNER